MLLLLALACGARNAPPPPVAEAGPVVLPSAGAAADLAAARAFSATRPPYERPFDDGTGALSAAACGACHTEIYAAWQRSTHARAWTDVQFQAEITKSGNRWLCLNCHTPLRTQQDRLAVGIIGDDVEQPRLVENGAFDPALRAEGITCAACHLRDGVIHGPGLPDSAAPHAVVADPDFVGATLCLRCHEAEVTYPGKSFACAFDTGATWAAGPAAAAGKACPDCHMPRSEAPAALGGPTRSVAQHGWPGSGIPKSADHQPLPFEPGLDLQAIWRGDTVQVTATNARAGHSLPTGDPERWIALSLTFTDAAGQTRGPGWSARIGQTWRWWPEAVRIADERIPAGGARSWTVSAPAGATEGLLVATSNRISAETAAYHQLGDYPRAVETHRLWLRP